MSSRVSVTHLPLSAIHSEAVNSVTIPNRASTSGPRTPVALNRQRLLEPLMPRPNGEDNTCLESKRQKVLKTSFNADQTCEVREYLTMQMLHLARKSRDVYTAKIHYQHLCMQELEMMKAIVQDELEETQGSLNWTERQIGQIRQELYGRKVIAGESTERWSRLFDAPLRAGRVSDGFQVLVPAAPSLTRNVVAA